MQKGRLLHDLRRQITLSTPLAVPKRAYESNPLRKSIPQWLEHHSPNFVLRFLPDSAAERDAPQTASRLETIRDAVFDVLDLRDVSGEQVHVYLSDLPNDRQVSDEVRGGWPSENEVGQIHALYTSDAPGEGLERAVVEMDVSLFSRCTGR